MKTLPVLVTCFARPDLLKRNLSSLILADIPLKLFFHIDGPRPESDTDSTDIAACKELINSFYGSEDYIIRCLPKNLGVRESMLSAISWFFEQVEYGLIIEEDIVIHPESPKLILDLLETFESDNRIGAISLHNNLPTRLIGFEEDFYLSNITFLWGWATWRDRWMKTSGGIDNVFSRLIKCRVWDQIGIMGFLYFLRFLKYKATKSWDGDLLLNFWECKYKTIHFRQSLAWNIGFDERATHTKNPIAQREIFDGQLQSLNEMSSRMSISRLVERRIIKYVFGLSGIRLQLSYLKWFFRNWKTM